MDIDINQLSEKIFYVVFVVVLLGAGVFNLILLKQLSLMHRVLNTPLITVFRLMAWVSVIVVIGLILSSIALLIS